MEKIIQFQALNVPNNSQTQSDAIVYALTEDGKLYLTDMFCKNGWMEMTKEKTDE